MSGQQEREINIGNIMRVTKELLHQAIDSLHETDLDEVYLLIQQFSVESPQQKGASLLSKLRSIQIDGPEDLAANSDAYVLGEKYV